jgi:competence protein ComEC
MMLGWIPYLGEGLGWVLSWLIQIQNEIAELIYILPGGKLERLVIDFWGMLLVWGTLLIWAGWETAKRKKLAWLALILVFCWSIASLSNVIFAPDIELLVYQGKKGKMFDYYRDGNLYSWNQGMEADEISFVVDPRRIVERRAHFPFGFSAGKKGDNNFLFPFHSISYSESQNRLYFAEQKPKSIQIWEGKEWADQELADSIDLGETAVRIIF